MTNRCGNSECSRPFGLVRFSWRFEQFCSNKCRAVYRRQRERNKTYWKWLYNCPAPSVADRFTGRASGTIKS
jgi:hypothetical protein